MAQSKQINWQRIAASHAALAAEELSANARTVLQRRYLIKDKRGQSAEEPQEMFRRVAENVALAENTYDGTKRELMSRAFQGLMSSLVFLPNSPTLMNAGRPLQQLAACFVLPVEDSMESIFDTLKATALIHQTGGGTGFSFSRLRPRGDLVQTSMGQASGPISFMRVYNEATRAISQGGFRRGANIGVLRVDHPDIREFLACKETEGAFENFNISVAITDEFMRLLDGGGDVALVNPRTGEVWQQTPAAELWHEIVQRAWSNGEPGLLFVDHTNADNPTPALGDIESTNPCGEQPLLPWEACNLGSINVARFVTGGRVDYERLADTVHLAVRFLDDTIDMSRYPLAEISQLVAANRKIGLGIMGWADALIAMGLAYDSPEALERAEELMATLTREAHRASESLAEERGAFGSFGESVFARRGLPPRRNATCTTIAPTGTLSLLASCSAGIEPLYSVAHERHVLGGERLLELQADFQRLAGGRGLLTAEFVEKLAMYSPRQLPELPDDLRRVFVTAHDIGAEDHVRMQAAFQKHVDNAVSKTINLPAAATVAEVDRAYRLAWQLGCKGITIYRDRSRASQVLVRANGRPMVCPDCVDRDVLEICPECGVALNTESACSLCPSCGYTRC